jgi:tetratricopeptide (TPR) repeat protein
MAGVAAAVVGIVAAASGIGHELDDDRHALYDAVVVRHMSAEAVRGLERPAMLRHPAEPYLPFMGAERASLGRDESMIPWIGATLERASVYGPAHFLLARRLAVRSPSQARMEYRFAIEQAPEFDATVMGEAPRVVNGYDDATELVPKGKEGPRVLEMLIGAIKDRLPATRVRLDVDLALRMPAKAAPAVRAATDAVEDVEPSNAAPWCADASREACVRDAIEKSRRAVQIEPNQCEPQVLRARARIAAGEAVAALNELQAATDSVTDRVTCLESLEGLVRSTGDRERAQAILEQIVRAGCSDDKECAQELSWVARRQEATGNPHAALAAYKRAYEHAPEDDALLESIARLAAQAGLHAEAAQDYDRLAVRKPSDARWPKAASEQRQAAVKDAMKL